MRLLPALLLLAILASPLCATADDTQCSSIPELKEYDLTGCECGKELSKLPITTPKGMTLIAACNYNKVEFVGIVGDFFFKGKATITGEVRHITNPRSGDSAIFISKKPVPFNAFRSATSSLRFELTPTTIQQLKLPLLSEASPCLAADAVINVNLLFVQAGEEEALEGNFPKIFNVQNLGEYKTCPDEE